MLHFLFAFMLHWSLIALALWAASGVFSGVSFSSRQALWLAALLLGFVNAVLRPLLILLTLPLTVMTFGLFLLAVNGLMLLLVARLIEGFWVSGFWTAVFAATFISVFSFFVAVVVGV